MATLLTLWRDHSVVLMQGLSGDWGVFPEPVLSLKCVRSLRQPHQHQQSCSEAPELVAAVSCVLRKGLNCSSGKQAWDSLYCPG